MDSLQPADAVASSTHVILVIGDEDAYGEHEVVEAKGCSYGVVRQSRTFSSSYSGARRINLSECVCNEGDEETQSCGDCGTQSRTCEGGCLWSPWSACEGPDPAGADAACSVDGETGACAVGRKLCVAGWLTCQPAAATTEVCDGLDNDCDGVVDNGTPASLGEGYPCANACGAGESQCIDGAVRCVTPGTTWPDESCSEGDDAGPESDGGDGNAQWATNEGSGCACNTVGFSASGTPVAPLLLLFVLGCGYRSRTGRRNGGRRSTPTAAGRRAWG